MSPGACTDPFNPDNLGSVHAFCGTCANRWPAAVAWGESRVVPAQDVCRYPDGRPTAAFRLDAQDRGIVLRYGDGPGRCDERWARDVWVWEHRGIYFMHYDGAGPKGWLTCLATSTDLLTWTKKGPVLDLGQPGAEDSASASYGVTFFDGQAWHMFYLGTPHTTPPPDRIPAFPYLTLKARSQTPDGPWVKRNTGSRIFARPLLAPLASSPHIPP